MNRFLVFLVAISLICLPALAETTGQLGGMDSDGNYYWTVDDDGTLIGGDGAEISLGGEEKSSWGDIVSPMTDQDGYVQPTDAGSKLKLHDDGGLTLGGAVATDVVVIFDSDTNDYYAGVNDSENEFQMGYGSVMGVTEQISILSNATVVLGEDTDVDFGLIFQSGAQDYYVGIDYTGGQEEDLLTLGRGSTVGDTPELAIGATAIYVNHLDAPGNVDLDIGSADVDDVTVVTDGGTIILDGTITLTDGEIISNAADDTVRVASNDLDTILEVYTAYDTTGDATLKLSADLGDAAKEQWTFTSTGDGNDLVVANDSSSSGTPVTKFTLDENGVVTTTSYIDSKITDTTTNAVVDVMKLTHDGGTAAAGVGAGLVYQIDDAGGIEEQGSIDVSLSTVTDAAEDADLVIRLNNAGTMREALRIDTDVSATEGGVLEYTSWTTQTDGVIDILELTLDNTADTATDDFGAGISIIMEQEDSGTPVQQASVDFVLVDSTTAVEDCDVVVSQATGGAVAETFRIVANSSATTGDSFTLTQNTTETDAILDILSLANVTGTATHNAGLGITWDFEDAAGAEEQASLDVQLIVATDGEEDADIIFSQQTDGAVSETFRIVGQAEAATGDYVKITQNTQETDAVLDILVLTNVTGTATTGAGLGISFQPEDATGAEEQASIDVVFTDALNASADVDFVFKQNVAGAIEERVRFDADDDTLLLTGTLPKMTIGDGGDEDAILTFDGQTNDFYVGFDTTDDLFNIGVGSTPGATCAIEIDASANTIITSSLKTPYQIVAATETLTANESMKLIVLNSATEFVTTLPTVASSGGVTFHIVIGAAPSGASYTVVTNASENKISGLALVNGASVQAALEDTITFTDTAAAVGDWVELTSDGVLWYVSGQGHAATAIVFTGT